MNEMDLRVIKTRESIEQAFLDLLRKKPVDKITIVELAREARINKGTFYLHFKDIFDLYHKTIEKQMANTFDDADYFNDFFDDPKRFCEALNATFSANIPLMDTLAPGGDTSFILGQTLDQIRGKIYATGRIAQSPVNDIKLDALFGALLICRPRYDATHNDIVDRVMLDMITHFKAD